jgi:hypothetical protein
MELKQSTKRPLLGHLKSKNQEMNLSDIAKNTTKNILRAASDLIADPVLQKDVKTTSDA